MKTKKFFFRNVMIAVLMVMLCSSVNAQMFHGGKSQKPNKQHQKENIEAMKVAFITRKLNLTTEEAKVFWPVYDEFEARKKELNQNAVSKYQKILTDSLTEKQATDLIDQQIIQAQKMLDLRKEYLVKFKQILPSKKIAKLYDAEKNFRRLLMKELREKRKEKKDK